MASLTRIQGTTTFVHNLEELRQAAEGGLLTETHWLDVKADLPAGPRHNKELARDLASFSIDGGTLIFGVAELPEGLLEVRGVSTTGMPERIEQVARMAVHPSLRVTTRLLASEDDPTQGCVIVDIPSSPAAPHQADDRYWGRNDKTKYPLPDDEVERVMLQRRLDRVDALQLLDEVIADDPTEGTALIEQGHLFVVAQPEWSSPVALLPLLNEHDVRTAINRELLHPIDFDRRRFGSAFAPDFNTLTAHSRGRISGLALHSGQMGAGRVPTGDAAEFDLLDVEIREDGGVLLFSSRATDRGAIMDAVILGLVQRVVDLAGRIGDVTNYTGSWALGVGITGLGSLSSYAVQSTDQLGRRGAAYSRNVYREVTRARTFDLLESAEGITEDLLGRLLRSLGSRRLFDTELQPPAAMTEA